MSLTPCEQLLIKTAREQMRGDGEEKPSLSACAKALGWSFDRAINIARFLECRRLWPFSSEPTDLEFDWKEKRREYNKKWQQGKRKREAS